MPLRLHTVGHSNHAMDDFAALLDAHGVAAVLDVRSAPYSAHAPQFNKLPLGKALADRNIDYLFVGCELGARRTEQICYVNGQARYDRIAALPAFRKGLDLVIDEAQRRPAALMCSEADPITCHRTVLVAREVLRWRPDTEILHILETGELETQQHVEDRLIALHDVQPELFGDMTSRTGLVDRAYDLQAEKIAFRSVPAEP